MGVRYINGINECTQDNDERSLYEVNEQYRMDSSCTFINAMLDAEVYLLVHGR
jgi:hypothetical protein